MPLEPTPQACSGPLFESNADLEKFKRELRTSAVGREIIFQPRTHSTNDLALAGARNGAAHGTLFITDEQQRGRGRWGRSWEAPPRLGLLFSVLIRPAALPPAKFGWLPLLAGWAAAEGLRQACALPARLKWPNDIVLSCDAPPGWKKLGGVLGESVLAAGREEPDSRAYFVLGIGLNINQQKAELPATAKAPPTSARLEKGVPFLRAHVLRAVLEQLDQTIGGLARSEDGLAAGQREIETQLRQWWPPERKLQLQMAGKNGAAAHREGYFTGLDAAGRLRLKTKDGGELVTADAEIISVA